MTSPAVSDTTPGLTEKQSFVEVAIVPRGTIAAQRLRWAIFEVLPRFGAILLCIWAVWAGLAVRGEAFAQTGAVRFRGDIQNGLNQGARVLANTKVKQVRGERIPLGEVLLAWERTYDRLYAAARGSKRYGLDYTPARLLVMTMWTREVWAERGVVHEYDDTMAWRLLWLNAGCGLATALGTFLVVRLWARREQVARGGGIVAVRSGYRNWGGSPAEAWSRHRGWLLGVVGALLVWFNVALLVNAHVFPQWDIWLMPGFVFAVYCASRGWWVGTGVLVALAAMLKGQVLMVLPVLAIWAIAGGVGGVLRLLVGLGAGACVVVWPWLARGSEAWVWGGLAAAGAVGVVVAREGGVWLWGRGRQGWRRAAALAMGAAAVGAMAMAGAYPAIDSTVPGGWFGWVVGGLTAIGVVAALWKGWRALPSVALGAMVAAVMLGGVRYGGSWSWFEIGFRFPTDNYLALFMGPTANIPAIMQESYESGISDVVWASSGGWELTLRVLLRGVYFLLLVPVGLMAAWHAKRGSARVLVCVAVPWVLMFAILPQMHERYLVWGALATALGVALGGVRGLGMVVLHFGVTWFALACVGTQVLSQNGGWWPEAARMLGPVIPGGGWGVAMIGAVMVGVCLTRPNWMRQKV